MFDPIVNITEMTRDGIQDGTIAFFYDPSTARDALRPFIKSVFSNAEHAVGNNKITQEWWSKHNLLFLRHKNHFPNGINMLGIVANGGVYVQKNLTVRFAPYINIRRAGALFLPPDILSQASPLRAADFFTEHRHCWRAFQGGIAALYRQNSMFFKKSMTPRPRRYSGNDDFECACHEFLQKIEVGDLIFSSRKYNPVSLLIRWLNNCRWSHVADYIGDGIVQELVPMHGLRRIKLLQCMKHSHEFGAYRYKIDDYELFKKAFLEKKEKDFAERSLRAGYGYSEAFRQGWTLLGEKIYRDRLNDTEGTLRCMRTPQDLLFNGLLFFVASV